jgi:hypothetical protein
MASDPTRVAAHLSDTNSHRALPNDLALSVALLVGGVGGVGAVLLAELVLQGQQQWWQGSVSPCESPVTAAVS